LKNMETGEQEEVSVEELIMLVKKWKVESEKFPPLEMGGRINAK
jgi:hypothetical protein